MSVLKGTSRYAVRPYRLSCKLPVRRSQPRVHTPLPSTVSAPATPPGTLVAALGTREILCS